MSEAKFEPGEGLLMSELTPHPPSLCSGTLSRKGRGRSMPLEIPGSQLKRALRCAVAHQR
jgi:hypothetical protein